MTIRQIATHRGALNTLISIAVVTCVTVAQFTLPQASSPAAASGVTLEVGAGQQYSSIQAAIQSAGNGDQIHVHSGTYRENLSINSKYISLLGDPGAVIQSAADGPAVVAIMNVPYRGDVRTKVSGFTIQGGNGAPGQGGGITVALQSDPEISNNIIQNNKAQAYGGGISIHTNSSPIIRNNTIRGNYALQGGAGVFAVNNSSPVIYGNTISGK